MGDISSLVVGQVAKGKVGMEELMMEYESEDEGGRKLLAFIKRCSIRKKRAQKEGESERSKFFITEDKLG